MQLLLAALLLPGCALAKPPQPATPTVKPITETVLPVSTKVKDVNPSPFDHEGCLKLCEDMRRVAPSEVEDICSTYLCVPLVRFFFSLVLKIREKENEKKN